MTSPEPTRRWFSPTPAWLVHGLLVVEGLLWLSERFQWFGFNQHKGWTVLIAVAAVGATILLMLLWFVASLLFRWRFQFSIRSLLVLTVAAAVPCSWLAVEMKEVRREREAVAAIAKLGGIVLYDWQCDADGNWLRIVQPPGATWTYNVLGSDFFANVVAVEWGVIGESSRPHSISYYSSCDDAALQQLKGQLKQLPCLRRLEVGGNRVTDAGLESLIRLDQLRVLCLRHAEVSDEGARKLQQALPNCKIDHLRRPGYGTYGF